MRTDEERLAAWDEIKRSEKAGKEWTSQYLPDAFREARELIQKAEERKGIKQEPVFPKGE